MTDLIVKAKAQAAAPHMCGLDTLAETINQLVAALEAQQQRIEELREAARTTSGQQRERLFETDEELRQHIEELTDKAASFEGSFNSAVKDIQRLDAALAEIKMLAESDRPWSQVIPAIIAKTEKARTGK